MWVPPENRDPVLLHHPTRRSVGYFGAVRLRDGRFLYRRETERFAAQTFFVSGVNYSLISSVSSAGPIERLGGEWC